ncbi:MAG: family 16 glycosylhydrolase [Sphingobacteriales bacterium]|nr:family 16 glycosylhydrolase [Sphingobacteriales bacterium]
MKPILFPVLLLLVTVTSCNKNKENGTTDIIPENLVVNAVVNPDNSGNVTFTASATHTVLYTFDLGNGVNQLSSTGTLSYKYTASGTYTITVAAKSGTGHSISKSITLSVNVIQTLVWSDEFDTPGAPDPAKWGYDLGAGGWGNGELQYYTNRTDNAVVSNGTLKIIAKAENFSGSPYTSARLLSRDKFSFKYGKIEARAKLPAGAGTWPAIWMLGNNIGTVGWPACGEIDIMEHRGNQLNTIFGTLHHPGHSGGNGDGATVAVPNVTTEFHRYAVEWTVSSIKFFVDDVVFYSFGNTGSLPFNQNFFVILNVAMGGSFGGAVDPGFSSAAMEIDYIRVYQ